MSKYWYYMESYLVSFYQRTQHHFLWERKELTEAKSIIVESTPIALF